MKKLLPILLLLLLPGCVSYYYPQVVANDEVYESYEEEYVDPAYHESDYSSHYSAANVYPWWSLDYFYLGSSHRHSTFSIGYHHGPRYNYAWYDPWSAWGYPAWDYYSFWGPYDRFYSPLSFSVWYSPFYYRSSGYWGWNDYYWRNRYNRHHRSHHRDHDRWADHNRYDGRRDDRYGSRDHNGSGTLDRNVASRDRNRFDPYDSDRDRNRRRGEDGPVPPGGESRHPGTGGGRGEASAMTRRVSAVSGRSASGRAMEIRNRGERKPSATRMEPVKPVSRSNAPTVVAAPQQNRPAYRSTRSGSAQVRSKAGAKSSKTRPSPVESRKAPVTMSPVQRGSTPVVSVNRGSATVRSPQQRKAGAVRTEPVRSRPAQVTSRSRTSGSVKLKQPTQRAAPVTRAKPSYSRPVANTRAKPSTATRSAPSIKRQAYAPRPAPVKPSATRPANSLPPVSKSNTGRSGPAARPSKPSKPSKTVKERR
jgi:hypothetical protein